jgi:hypothetical protein
MQVVVQKTQDIHPAKQSVVNKQDNELTQAQMQNKVTYVRDRERVLNTEKTELKKIRGDEERHAKGHSKQSDKHDSDEASEKNKKNSSDLEPIGIHFDMKV